MPSLRYVLFRSRTPGPANAVTRRIAQIANVAATAKPPRWTVTDKATGAVVEVTLAKGPLVAADIRALLADHWKDDAEGRAMIAKTDARCEIRFSEDDAGKNLMILVQDALERATGGFGYDLAFNRIVFAEDGESLVTTLGPEDEAENERLMDEIAAKSDEEIDRDIAEAGGDPAAIRQEGSDFVARLRETQDLFDSIEEALARPGLVAREPRPALMKRLADVRSVAIVGGAIQYTLKKRPLATMSDGELQAIADGATAYLGRGRA